MPLKRCPPVTVITTVYNREALLRTAMESVLGQSYPDFEYLVLDDASDDGSFDSAMSFGDPRVRVLRNPERLGDYPNRTRAAMEAKGQLIKYVDSDDRLVQGALAQFVEAMERYPDAGLGASRFDNATVASTPVLSPAEAYRKHFMGGGLLTSLPPGKAILRTKAFREIGAFGQLRYVGDRRAWFRLAARHPVVLLPDGLLVEGVGDSQRERIAEKRTLLPVELDRLRILLASLGEGCPLNGSERLLAERHARRDSRYRTFQIYRSGQLKLGEAIRMIGYSFSIITPLKSMPTLDSYSN